MYQGAFHIIILPVNLNYAKYKVEKTNSLNFLSLISRGNLNKNIFSLELYLIHSTTFAIKGCSFEPHQSTPPVDLICNCFCIWSRKRNKKHTSGTILPTRCSICVIWLMACHFFTITAKYHHLIALSSFSFLYRGVGIVLKSKQKQQSNRSKVYASNFCFS